MEVSLVACSTPAMMPVAGALLTTSAPSTGNAIYNAGIYRTYQVIAGAAATVIIEVTNEKLTAQGTNSNWVLLTTLTLAGAGTSGFATSDSWRWSRARVTAASAATSVLVGG